MKLRISDTNSLPDLQLWILKDNDGIYNKNPNNKETGSKS